MRKREVVAPASSAVTGQRASATSGFFPRESATRPSAEPTWPRRRPVSERAEPHCRFRVDVHLDESAHDVLSNDARTGLRASPKSLPAKYFYDELGSRLFDRICDTPEYYQTRTEQALLATIARPLVSELMPSDIVELGSGAARKTRMLFDALVERRPAFRYVPFDVSESMLRASAERLLLEYPALSIHGVVGDYERHLEHVPDGERRLFVFLGSTIGNFEPQAAEAFITRISERMGPDDWFLLGTDLIKDERVLHAAYNDAQRVTEAFNKNVLSVLNRELGGSFRLDDFAHVAFFNRERSQIEMHLEAKRAHTVSIRALELDVSFSVGERMRTEISRKFSERTVSELLEASGQRLRRWFSSPDGYFGLALSQRK